MTLELQSLEQMQRALASRLVRSQESVDGVSDTRLTGLDPEELLRSSLTLKRKRLCQTAALLPITRRLLGTAFDRAFLQFANELHFNGRKALFQDAVAFSGWLSHRLDGLDLPVGLCTEQIAECCRFEAAICRWHASNWGVWLDRFAWDWRYASPAGGDGDAVDVPRRAIRRWLWRFGPWTGGRVWG